MTVCCGHHLRHDGPTASSKYCNPTTDDSIRRYLLPGGVRADNGTVHSTNEPGWWKLVRRKLWGLLKKRKDLGKVWLIWSTKGIFEGLFDRRTEAKVSWTFIWEERPENIEKNCGNTGGNEENRTYEKTGWEEEHELMERLVENLRTQDLWKVWWRGGTWWWKVRWRGGPTWWWVSVVW